MKRYKRITERSLNGRFINRVHKSSFAQIEDSRNAIDKIRKIASAAVRMAADNNRQHGLAAIVIRANQVIKVKDNSEQVIATINKKPRRQYKTGEVLYARKG